MKHIFGLALALSAALVLAACSSSAPQPLQNGFTTVTTPASELEELKLYLEDQGVPCGIGMATSNDEMIATTQAGDEARTAVAVSIKTVISRYKEQYAKNVGADAGRIWEEKANEYTEQELVGATLYRSIKQFNEVTGEFRVYALVAMNPDLVRKSIEAASEGNEEFLLRAESADMQARMDKAAAAYKEKRSAK